MRVTKGRLLSLLIAIGYLTSLILVEQGVTSTIAAISLVLLFPLALIWFPDELGSITGPLGRSSLTMTDTPARVIAGLGWFFLVGLPLLVYLFANLGQDGAAGL